MSTNIAPPLRASCDRCRAQKLRCVSSSTTDATAPCQRCLRAKSPKSCVFSQRLRTGRSVKITGDGESRQGAARREKDKSPALPGMSAFSLSTPSPSKCASMDTRTQSQTQARTRAQTQTQSQSHNQAHHRVPRSEGKLDALDLECEDLVASSCEQRPGDMIDLWEADNTILQPSSLFSGTDELSASPEMSDYTFDVGAYFDAQDFLLPQPYPTPIDMVMDIDELAAEKPGPLVDLTALLAKMSHYESQLSKLAGGDLDNYPIGDALFLSQRFYTILTEHDNVHCITSSSHLDMPTKLLTLSCYMTLTRVYSSVFGYLHERLSQLPEAHFAHDSRRHSASSLIDMHAYRGLRLGQIQPICACAGRESATRVKKAVSMLLGSLGGAEEMLGLPSDVRVTASIQVEAHAGKGMSSLSGHCDERIAQPEDGLLVGLTNSRLRETVREQAGELRGKVDEVDDILKGLFEL
ncbi:uncharacterized protein GIQ15_03682 [Arthroderma uncinatum]|uniref:uncharacterized protein n=1 Tax=Arthroderma uncinatum TaxID=74035 RepID=UPI00144A9514|nr:uncharacterized protein GIQ15_03682 [Arthroderma uncinatum]KAF3484358.1 hypothetical protein GIQ15_03682 [Arthroderma uncinatum]